MESITTIQHNHSQELDELNARIAKRLDSSNSLMSQVVMSHLRTKGKQLRPLMVLLCAKMFGELTPSAYAAAAAIELIHNASLIHDDVVDNSTTRRNRPTINAVWDNHIAVLVGDFFTSAAMQEAISTNDIRIVDELCGLGRQLSLGEIDQIYNAREHILSEENYLKVINYKTASLFVASAKMGCLAAGVDDERLLALADYALLFGLCFQIRDDIFDYYPADLIGKPSGNDLKEGKISLPLLYVLSRKDLPNHEAMYSLIQKDNLSDDEIMTLQEYTRANGGIEYAYEMMHSFRKQALAHLDTLPDTPERKELALLFDFIIDRQF